MTQAELMERMSATEFLEWMILESIEPFGEKAQYLRAGVSFDFEKGIQAAQTPKTLTTETKPVGEPIKMTTPEGMNAIMQAFSMMNPGKIRMRPKSKPN